MNKKISKTAESSGEVVGAIGSAHIHVDNVSFGARQGHGFAAERANHRSDIKAGKNAKLIGGDNVKNGADRLVNGARIQTKYWATPQGCVNDCFDKDGFKYWNKNGTPMKLEVPPEQHAEAVKVLSKKIKEGAIKGITDPRKANNLVISGDITYQQAINITKAGNIDSLKYDAKSGALVARTAAGISAVITFAVAIWNGEDVEAALSAACVTGIKVGGIAWATTILTAQLGKTALVNQGLQKSSKWLIKQINPKAAALMVDAIHTSSQAMIGTTANSAGKNIAGRAVKNRLLNNINGNVAAVIAVTMVSSSADLLRIFNGRISGAQLFKNVTNTAAGAAGGMCGAAAGLAKGARFGPVGMIVGSLIGGMVGGGAARKMSSVIMEGLIEDDAKKMMKILQGVFVEQAQSYLLGTKEADELTKQLESIGLIERLRDMHVSSEPEEIARSILIPLVESVIATRKTIILPADEEWAKSVGKLIEMTTAKGSMTERYIPNTASSTTTVDATAPWPYSKESRSSKPEGTVVKTILNPAIVSPIPKISLTSKPKTKTKIPLLDPTAPWPF